MISCFRFVASVLFISMVPVVAGDPPTKLFLELEALDKALFKAGYDCHLDAFDQLMTEDLEFYHDQAPTSLSREAFKEAIANLCAAEGRLRRELVPGSLQVYPMFDGAVQMGVHRFYTKNQAGELVEGSTAKFIHLWKKKNGKWLLARVISYDHQSPPVSEKN